MNTKPIYIKFLLSAVFFMLLNAGSATFIGKKGFSDDGAKFSLKNLSRYRSNVSLANFKLSQFQFAGSQDFSHSTGNGLQFQSMFKMERGNTTYVFPYRAKVQMSRFKAPVPQHSH